MSGSRTILYDTAVLWVVAMGLLAGLGAGTALPAEGLELSKRIYHGGGAEIPLAGKVCDIFVILIALPGLIWCLGERFARSGGRFWRRC
jgi:hypothetical protein